MSLNIILKLNLGTLLLTCYAIPWILVIMIPLLLVVNNLQQYYRYTARQLRRLASISLSPIFAHFSETIQGMRNMYRYYTN